MGETRSLGFSQKYFFAIFTKVTAIKLHFRKVNCNGPELLLFCNNMNNNKYKNKERGIFLQRRCSREMRATTFILKVEIEASDKLEVRRDQTC